MTIFAAALAIAAFLAAFRSFAIVGAARQALALAASATGVMRDKTLSDDEKEAAVQRAALSMLRASGSIFWRVAATLICTVAPIYALDIIGFADAGQVLAFLARPDVIISASILVGGGLWWFSRRPKRSSAYSVLDRTLHRIAFAAPFVQMTAADVENTLFARQINGIEDKPPIFITSLPRAGTTVVLNALHGVPGVATHLYRDMPFVMAPMLWSRVSRGFARTAKLAERAHGDGIMVGYDSPEAFEDVLWRQFWPERFELDHIPLWSKADTSAEATEFFRTHFRKIIALRTGPGGRYTSKNNGNIARLDVLGTMFPDADIIVPLRNPAEHAASLLRQHLNFVQQHKRDAFAKRYMRDIRHLEFGELHRPVAFVGMAERAAGLGPEDPDYWLAYWISAYTCVAAHTGDLIIVSEGALQTNGQVTMRAICAELGLEVGDTDFSQHFKAIAPRADISVFDAVMLDEAMEIYGSLRGSGRLPNLI